MEDQLPYQQKFDELSCCVLIPTYNNEATLERVIMEVQRFTSNIIVVNDGSTDATLDILRKFPELETLSFPENKGKGMALRAGFKKAGELGYEYAISMDSDGQHFPDDLPVFIEELKKNAHEEHEILVVGSRKMDDPSVPEKSSVGNRCSSFWFWVETGVELQDTQCGYRLYPLKTMNSLRLFTSKFELEIEVLVKASWEGVEVKNLPVKVLYDPLERVTHFRPIRDVARITLLNIWFVGAAVFYVAPKKILGKFRRSKPKAVRQKVLSKVGIIENNG